jgi:hypothetical protein
MLESVPTNSLHQGNTIIQQQPRHPYHYCVLFSSPCFFRISQEILLHIVITVGDAMAHR